MRNLFSWRIKPSEAEFSDLWENATFVFDTNFLLDLYRVSRFTAENFLNILEHIQDRIWLPYQVVNEFFNRREDVIHSEAESFQKALSEVTKWKTENQKFSSLHGSLSQVGRIVSAEVEFLFNEQKAYLDAIEKVEQSFREKIEQLEKDHASLNPYEDSILEKLLLLFDDAKVGEPFPEADLVNLYEDADKRYQRLQAPGFMDMKDKKDERKYGDFLLWKQILNFAKKESRPIIFVTGEKKEDWWIKRRGEIVSPREDLRREFLEFTQQPFWMYRTQRFLELAKQKLNVEIDSRSIDETIAIADLESVDETDDESLSQSLEQIQISDSAKQPFEHNKMSKGVSQMIAESNFAKVLAEQSNFAKAVTEQSNLTNSITQILAERSNFAKILAEQSIFAKAVTERSNFAKILAEQSNFFKTVTEQSNFFKTVTEQSNLTNSITQILAEQQSNFAKALAERSNGINALSQTSDDLSQVHEQAKIADDS